MARLMTIGEFATATWLSPKALRLYDEKGLLSPDTVEPHSGYRKYSPAQVETARLITLLRRIDMPLEHIGTILAAPSQDRSALVADYRKRDAERYARRQSLARFLEHALGAEALDGHALPGVSRFELGTRFVPDTAVLTAVRQTTANELPEVIQEAATRLMALAEHRGGTAGELVVIYHGQVGWESDGPIEVCVPVGTAGRAHRVEPGHEELFTTVLTEDVQFPGILAAFEAVRRGATDLGLTPIAPPREVYTWPSDGRRPHCTVAIPVSDQNG